MPAKQTSAGGLVDQGLGKVHDGGQGSIPGHPGRCVARVGQLRAGPCTLLEAALLLDKERKTDSGKEQLCKFAKDAFVD